MLLACPGVRRTYIQSDALFSEMLLNQWVTGVRLDDHSIISKLPGVVVRKSKVPRGCIRTVPFTEAMFKASSRLSVLKPLRHRLWLMRNIAFSRVVLTTLVKNANIKLVHSYSSACGETSYFLRNAPQNGNVKYLVEHTSAPQWYEKSLLLREMQRWNMALPESDTVMPDFLREHEVIENSAADYILVGSEFAKGLLVESGIDESKLFVLERPTDVNYFTPVHDMYRAKSKLQLLFVGAVSLLKGSPYLLESMGKLENVVLHVAGKVQLPEAFIRQFNKNVVFHGYLNKKQLRELYRSCDVYVHPSLTEDSPHAVREAMACGLPVIATKAAGSSVSEGVNGFIIKDCSSEDIAKKLGLFIEDRALLSRMGMAARSYAEMRFTEERYKKSYVELLGKIM